MLAYWLADIGAEGNPGRKAAARWFQGGQAVDEEIRARFGEWVEKALAGDLDLWAASAQGRLALVLLLDQFPRNLYRGRAEAFSGDPRALELTWEALERHEDRELSPTQRYFLYMPLEHAEDLEAQAEAVRRFRGLADEQHPSPFFSGGVDWALRHQKTIERFGRFPARNAALGRPTSPTERAFLEEHPAGF